MSTDSPNTRRGFFRDALRNLGRRAADAVEERLRATGMKLEGGNPRALAATSGDGGSHAGTQAADAHETGDVPVDDRRAPSYFYDRPWFRPPGATHESEFLSMCERCRRCVDVCPEHCIVPAQSHMGAPVGTPILFPNLAACTLCGDCMDACPSGALLPTPKELVRIGIAVIRMNTCIAFGEQHCSACHDACPVEPNAVVFPDGYAGTSPQIDPAWCTGCGLCVPACPTAPKSIEVVLRPLSLLRAEG